jgi:hypothetical protein
MDTVIREPAVSGRFYPAHSTELQSEVARLTPTDGESHHLLACIAPHAGYVYSGGVAGQLFGHLEIPTRVIVLGPNHTGLGPPVSVASHAAWSLPGGDVPIDRELADAFLGALPQAQPDQRAHRREHSIEVMLPFLRARRPDVRILPICLGQLDGPSCALVGHALAEVIADSGEPVGIVASSDMSHYEPDGITRDKDRLAIDQLLALDPQGLHATVHNNGITMCGVVPATVALTAALELGARHAHLVAYATSGDVNQDRSSVVGYAGVCIHA